MPVCNRKACRRKHYSCGVEAGGKTFWKLKEEIRNGDWVRFPELSGELPSFDVSKPEDGGAMAMVEILMLVFTIITALVMVVGLGLQCKRDCRKDWEDKILRKCKTIMDRLRNTLRRSSTSITNRRTNYHRLINKR